MYNTSEEYKNLILADSTRHVLNIYIDGERLEDRYIKSLKFSHVLFENDEFEFGGTPSKTAELSINIKALPETYNRIYIESGIDNTSLTEIIPMGYFNVDNIDKTNNTEVKLSLVDDMNKFEFNYDGSELSYPATMLTILQDICDKAGVELGSTDFLNSDTTVAVYDSTITAKEYISYIAEKAGGFAIIGRDAKLYIKTIGDYVMDTIEFRKFADYTWGEEFKISRISYEDGTQDFKAGDETESTVWIDSNNMFITSQEEIDNIYNSCDGFECYAFEGTVPVDPALDIGDILIIDGQRVIYQGDLEFKGKFKASIKSKVQAKTAEESTKTISSTTNKIRRVQSQINQDEALIEQLIQESSEYEEQIINFQITLDGIQQIIDNNYTFLREQSAITQIYLDNVATGRGYVVDFVINGSSYYCNSNYLRICVSTQPRGYGNAIYLGTEDGQDLLTEDEEQIIISSGSYYVDYIDLVLDDVLRDYIDEDGNTYYDSIEIAQDGTITLTRRIGVDEEGNLYLLDEEIVTVLDETLVLPSDENGYYYFVEECEGLGYYAKYIIKNDYSDYYATKVELSTAITETESEYEIKLSQKVNDDEIIAKINMSAETIAIEASKINLNGYISNEEGSFSIDEDGNASFSNGSVTINQDGIQMADGTSIIGGEGIYTNLMFNSDAGFLGIGGGGLEPSHLEYLTVYAQIPENFVIKQAYITIRHQPVDWTYSEISGSTTTSKSATGYARNIQIFANSEDPYTSFTAGSNYDLIWYMSGTKTTALGSSGKTFSSTQTETIVSSDLSQYLTAGEFIQFDIGTTDTIVGTEDYDETCPKCGRAIAQLQVIGYLQTI